MNMDVHWVPHVMYVAITILCIPHHHTLHTSIGQLSQWPGGHLDSPSFAKQPQMLHSPQITTKHVLVMCGTLAIHSNLHQLIQVSCCLECFPIQIKMIFHRHIGMNKHCSTFVPMAANARCKMNVLWCIPLGILDLNSQLPILSLCPLLEKLISPPTSSQMNFVTMPLSFQVLRGLQDAFAIWSFLWKKWEISKLVHLSTKILHSDLGCQSCQQ